MSKADLKKELINPYKCMDAADSDSDKYLLGTC